MPESIRGGEMKERREAIEQFRTKLSKAKTPEEKRALLEEFRKTSAVDRGVKGPQTQKNAAERISELKANAAGNPAMLKRVEQMEARLGAMEAVKQSLKAVGEAQGEDKQHQMEEAGRKRQALAQLQQADMQRMRADAESRKSLTEARKLPPEMAALKAKSEGRRQEIEQFKEALDQAATPEEKGKLLSQWRSKQQQEMAERKSRMDRQLEETKQP